MQIAFKLHGAFFIAMGFKPIAIKRCFIKIYVPTLLAIFQ